MRVLVMLSGGVDSSVAAARLVDAGHDVVGVTLKLWGGESDTGCCSVADVDDARRAADRIGVEHHVFNLGDEFTTGVVEPYVAAHAAGRTPNPCVECNRNLKFGKVLHRAEALGFDAVATGHHARVVERPDGTRRLARGADAAKDQSYVLGVLDQRALARTLLPVGTTTKGAVREEAARLGLVTAAKPDSQEVCFIRRAPGRRGFLADRLALTPARVVDTAGRPVGRVEALELVTIGQRRGLGVAGGGPEARYVVDVDVGAAEVVVGAETELLVTTQALVPDSWTWADTPVCGAVLAQCSAHGEAAAAGLDAGGRRLRWVRPRRRVAPGQLVVVYEGDEVVGSAVAR